MVQAVDLSGSIIVTLQAIAIQDAIRGVKCSINSTSPFGVMKHVLSQTQMVIRLVKVVVETRFDKVPLLAQLPLDEAYDWWNMGTPVALSNEDCGTPFRRCREATIDRGKVDSIGRPFNRLPISAYRLPIDVTFAVVLYASRRITVDPHDDILTKKEIVYWQTIVNSASNTYV